MPRTVESIVAAHQAAQKRRSRGERIWEYELNVSLPADDPFEKNRDQFAAALAASRWFKEYGSDIDSGLHELWDEIKDAEDVAHFDMVLDAIYDEADFDRCWIRIQR